MPSDTPKTIFKTNPGTAYTSGTDLIPSDVDLEITGTVRVTVAVSALSKMFFRVGSQNLSFNSDEQLAADTFYSFEFGVTSTDDFNIRFENSITIRFFIMQLYRSR